MNARIDITVPILNEEATLYGQITQLCGYLAEHLTDLGSIRIVLADNGSTDATPVIARALSREFADIRYVRLEKRGVGLALKTSWAESTADIIGYMDLDLATDLRYLRPALEKLIADQADIVTGSRLAKGARVIGRSVLRNFTSRCFNSLVKIVFHTSFSDGMCGFKFLQRKGLAKLLEVGAQSDGWFFASELLITAEYLGYRVYDLPVVWTDDPNSKVKLLKLSLEYVKAIRQLRQRVARNKESL